MPEVVEAQDSEPGILQNSPEADAEDGPVDRLPVVGREDPVRPTRSNQALPLAALWLVVPGELGAR